MQALRQLAKALTYYPVTKFIACGPNIELSSKRAENDLATRKKGLISAVCITSELPPVDGDEPLRYYYEVEAPFYYFFESLSKSLWRWRVWLRSAPTAPCPWASFGLCHMCLSSKGTYKANR